MTLELDGITFKRLVLAKKIFSRGVSQLESAHNFADKIIGLVSLDLANETILKAVIGGEPRKANESNFHGLISVVNKFLKNNDLEKVPDEANVKKVRNLRNNAQHDAECPNDNSLSDCRTYTADFLSKIISNVWGREFGALSLISLVNAPHLKALLEKAAANFEKNEFTDACFDAVAAFDRLIRSTRVAVVGNDNQVFYRQGYDISNPEFSAQLQSIVSDINELKTLSLHSVLRIDLKQYNKYRAITAGINSHWMGSDTYQGTFSRGSSEDEAAFVLNFVTNTIIDIEGLVGDIEKPFGIQRLY